MSPCLGGSTPVWLWLVRVRVSLWEMENELRAFSDFAFDLDITPMGMDDAARDRKPQPRPAGAAIA